MSENSLQRPILLTLAGLTTLTVLYYAYSQISPSQLVDEKSPALPQSLQRRNAVRRSRNRRRWRRGFPSQELVIDPTEGALANLRNRIDARQGYGEYQNSWVFLALEDSTGVDLTLIPSNLDTLHETIVQRYPNWTDYQRDSLRAHIHAMFVQNFLKEEYPHGYIIGDDVTVLETALMHLGVQLEVIGLLVQEFDGGSCPMSEIWRPVDEPPGSPRASQQNTDAGTEDLTYQENLLASGDDNGEDERLSQRSFSQDNHEDPAGSQNLLDLLYHISADQARRDGYIHRSVQCNSCGACPIQGIRYHCSNCYDYDLCETCEAGQVHARNHVFYKVRIPVPSRGHIKQIAPKWYPGNPAAFPPYVPREISKKLSEEIGMDITEMEALYEQFKCIAGTPWTSDPSTLGVAIDKREFDAYFISTGSDKPSPANLIYDRIFAFYDTNSDGLIGFGEYIRGLANLQDKSRNARLRRMFRGYDLDGDEYIDRKDFLRIFRAHYALTKELSKEKINAQEDFPYIEEEIGEVIQGSQPISAAFGGHSLFGHESRAGEDKQRNPEGDLTLSNGPNGVLQNDTEPRGDRTQAIGNAALGHRPRNSGFRSFRQESAADEPLLYLPSVHYFDLLENRDADDATEEELNGPDPPLQMYGWPPLLTPDPDDIVRALGRDMPLEEITDPVDRSRVFYEQSSRLDAEIDESLDQSKAKAIQQRWHRRQFYLDEEDGLTRPQGYTEPDSSDDETPGPAIERVKEDIGLSSRRQSMRSRSSSKVRFDDSAIDTDYETRSNTSSRSVPVNERWGGFEFGQAEAEIGKEILYQAVQEGFNELLDFLFKDKEDEAMEALQTKTFRIRWKSCLDEYEQEVEKLDQEKDHAVRQALAQRAAEKIRVGGDTKDLPSAQDLRGNGVLGAEEMLPLDVNNQPSTDSGHSGDGEPRLAGEALSAFPVEMEDSSASSLHRDPTLPQFRPNEAYSEDSFRHAAPPARPDKKTLAKFLLHRKIDKEAERRGGYGKLNFREFKLKMVVDDENASAFDKRTDGGDEEGGNDYWSKSAELQKLAFAGTWLEMASF